MEFQRARTEEQREQRRRVLLDTAARMLAEMPIAEMSLNELSRRVGLGKANVLRYYESREAILLELLNIKAREWLGDLDQAISASAKGSFRERCQCLVAALATTLEARPVLCDLISSQATVLERNVSTEVVLRHKRAMQEIVIQLAQIVTKPLPELTIDDGYQFASTTILLVTAAWPYSTPTAALLAAYDADPAIAELRMSFSDIVAPTLRLTLIGLLRVREGRPAAG